MTKFLDGPAEGVTLMLQRAPFFLRAVRAADGDWDALDQLGDTPAADETIVAYEAVPGTLRRAHVQRRERGRRVCGWYEGYDYRAIADQPDDATLRSTTRWREWCQAHAPAEFRS